MDFGDDLKRPEKLRLLLQDLRGDVSEGQLVKLAQHGNNPDLARSLLEVHPMRKLMIITKALNGLASWDEREREQLDENDCADILLAVVDLTGRRLDHDAPESVETAGAIVQGSMLLLSDETKAVVMGILERGGLLVLARLAGEQAAQSVEQAFLKANRGRSPLETTRRMLGNEL